MTAKDHNKLLGIFFSISAGLGVLGIVLGALMYGGFGIAMMSAGNRNERTMGMFFLIGAVALIPIGLIFLIPQILAALKMIKNKPGARTWGIIAAILMLLSFPIGTALGIYALWFLFSENGKAFYAGGTENQFSTPPPPPNNWR